jgi:RIP homotypic interaction motif
MRWRWVVAVSLIVDALVIGAAAGASATATTAVTDAYTSLKSGVRRLLRKEVNAAVIDTNSETSSTRDQAAAELDDLMMAIDGDPEPIRDTLTELLTVAGADQDSELMEAARRVLELVDPDRMRTDHRHIHVHDSTGVQVGDGNTMTLYLGDQHRRQQ